MTFVSNREFGSAGALVASHHNPEPFLKEGGEFTHFYRGIGCPEIVFHAEDDPEERRGSGDFERVRADDQDHLTFKVSPARSKPGRAVRSEGMPPGCVPVVHLVGEVAAEGGTYTVTGRESPGKSDVVFSAAVDRTGKAADALFC